MNGFLVQYADNKHILRCATIHNLTQLIKDIEETQIQCRRFLFNNGVMFNSSKTQCIFIGNRQCSFHIPPNTTVNFNGIVKYPNKHLKTLGVYFDRYLLFNVHIDEMNKKGMGILMHVSRSSHTLGKSSRIMVI